MDYLKISTLEEASAALKGQQNSKVLAGGTDLMVHYRHKKINPELVVDVKGIDILSGIKQEENFLKIGACTCLNDVASHPLVKEEFRALAQAANEVGCHQVRNRATIGGNICNASPAADTVPPLYCMDALVTYFKDGQMIDCRAEEFFIGPGKTVLPFDAILCQVKIPMDYAGKPSIYLRHSRRRSLDLSTVSVTVVNNNGKFTVALGSVAPTVIRVPKAEVILNAEGLNESSIKETAEAAKASCSPITDLRGSKEYRLEMVKNYTMKALRTLMEEQN